MIDWANLSDRSIREKWNKLNRFEKREQYRNTTLEGRNTLENVLPASEIEELGHMSSQVDMNSNDSVSGQEEIEFEIERIHEERVEEELRLIRENSIEYANSSEKRSRKRRTENIYILIALGIVGGYLTYNPQLELPGFNILGLVTLGFAIASAAFLFIKVVVVSQSGIGRETLWTRLDNFVDKSFPGLVTGVAILGFTIFIVDTFQIESTDLIQTGTALLSIIVTVLTILSRLATVSQSEPISIDELENAIFELPAATDLQKENNIDKFVSQLENYQRSGGDVSQLEELKQKVELVKGLSEGDVEKIQREINRITEEAENENIPEEKIRKEKIDELEQKREEYLDRIRSN